MAMDKDLVIITLGRVLQIIIMLVSIRLLTTFLSPKEVGNYYLILSLLAFFNLVLLNPPGMYFSRHIIQWEKSQNLLNSLFVFIAWMIIVALLSIPVNVILYYQLGYEAKFDLNLFLIYFFLAVIISTIHRNMLYGSNMLGYRKEFVIYLIITLVLGLIFSITMVYLFDVSALVWLLGVVASEFLMLYMLFKLFIKDNKLDIDKIKKTLTRDRIRKILIFSLPIGLTTFLMWGQNTAYRFIVDYQYSAEVLGYIAVGLGVSSAVFGSIESISMQYLNPIFYKNILNANKQQRAKAWNDMAQQIVPIYILTVFFTISMSEVLINILVDEKFHDSYIYTMFGVGIEFFRVMTNLLNNVSQSEHITTVTIKPYLVGFIISLGILSSINFGMNYFMIPLTLAIAYFSVFIYMYINMKKLLDIKYDINLVKTVLWSLPFFMVYFIDVSNLDILYGLGLVSLFGLYFLFVVWLLYTQNVKGKK